MLIGAFFITPSLVEANLVGPSEAPPGMAIIPIKFPDDPPEG